MHYYVTLIVGGLYHWNGKQFFLTEEQAVSEKEYDYLSSLYDSRLVESGNGMAVVKFPLFKTRVEEKTTEEKVLEKIESAPDTLKPTRK
jgi:hypothetical protein